MTPRRKHRAETELMSTRRVMREVDTLVNAIGEINQDSAIPARAVNLMIASYNVLEEYEAELLERLEEK